MLMLGNKGLTYNIAIQCGCAANGNVNDAGVAEPSDAAGVNRMLTPGNSDRICSCH